MRDEKDYNERLDDFSDYMRRRLEEHQLPVDADGWNEVEARMNRKPGSRGWWWTSGFVAAAVLAMVIWLLPSPEEMPLEESLPFQERMSEKTEGVNTVPEELVLPAKPIKKGTIAKMIGETIPKDPVTVEYIAITEEDEAVEDMEYEPMVDMEQPEKAPVDTSSVKVKKSDSTVPSPEGKKKRTLQTSDKIKKGGKSGKRNKWLLAAAVGSSGYVDRLTGMNEDLVYDPSSPGNGMNDSDPDPDSGDNDDTNIPPQTAMLRSSQLRSSTLGESFLNGDRSFESYPDVSYSLPLSFGFTVRKDLSRYIGVESGLMYTYLSTTFKRGGANPSEVKSNLHYLGIPLNLVVYLWNNERWNIYLSGGAMVEKGLQAVYSGYLVENGGTIHKSRKESIDGWQWSMNASIGASYRLYGAWSLYFEPLFSHYFDCHQPASIRTDKPLGFGLSAGIRYAF